MGVVVGFLLDTVGLLGFLGQSNTCRSPHPATVHGP